MSMQIEVFQKAADLKGLIIRVLQKLGILLCSLPAGLVINSRGSIVIWSDTGMVSIAVVVLGSVK